MAEQATRVSIRHPINVQGIDISQDPFYPSAFVIALPLDTEPSYVWLTFFEQELWGSLDFWDRKVVIAGHNLKLVTTNNHVEDKLAWLEKVILAANKRIEEYNRNIKVERNEKEEKLLHEESIRNALSRWVAGRTPG